VLAPGDLSDLQPLNLHNRTPLWFYILREAQPPSFTEIDDTPGVKCPK
jgi:hypothetical protein